MRKLPILLLLVYLGEFIFLAIAPYDRSVWWAENLPVLIIVGFLVLSYRSFSFSSTAYLMMSVFILMHTIGGHYTFERVPFDFITDIFGFERNHYDRIAHFSVGFYAYPLAEFLWRKGMSKSNFVLFLFPICFIFSIASIYEIIEWIYAVKSAPEAGTAFLGSQGDIWDAQKDMLADGLGSIVATVLFFFIGKRGTAPN